MTVSMVQPTIDADSLLSGAQFIDAFSITTDTTDLTARQATVDKIGIFPVLDETPQRLLAGFNDIHLDFRVVVDVAAAGAGQRVTATTVVLMHNWLGRIYLAIIKPFHRMVVRTALKQVTRET